MSVQVQAQAARALLLVIRSALARSPEFAGEAVGIDTVLGLLAPVEAFVAERMQQDSDRREADVRRKRERKSRGNPPDEPPEIPRLSGGNPAAVPAEVAQKSGGNPPATPPAPPRKEEKGRVFGSSPDQESKTLPPLPPAQSSGVARNFRGSEQTPPQRLDSNDLERLWKAVRREAGLGGQALDRSDYTRAQNAIDLAFEEAPTTARAWCERGMRNYIKHANGLEREKRFPFWGWAKDPARWATFDPDIDGSTDEELEAKRRESVRKVSIDLDMARIDLAGCKPGQEQRYAARVEQLQAQLEALGVAS